MRSKKGFKELSLEEKIGHLIVTYLHSGTNMDEMCRSMQNKSDLDSNKKNIKRIASQGLLGGVCFIRNDFKDLEELVEFIDVVQNVVSSPLLLMADMETGVSSLVSLATDFPFNMALGATRSEELAWDYGTIVAQEARACGLNMITCPVVDVNMDAANPIVNVRSYSDDVKLVAKLGASFIKGCQEKGLIACAKHFPGSGDMAVDSHQELPVISRSREELYAVDLLPYREAISSNVRSIMTTHIAYPALDSTPNLPATLSSKILTNLLREEMGFEGMVISDAMVMNAISMNYTMKESLIQAVNAGCDLLLVNEPEKAFEFMLEGLKEKRISEKRIDDSVRRILDAKEWIFSQGRIVPELDYAKKRLGIEDHVQKAYEIARRSITIFEGDLPDSTNKSLFIMDSEYPMGPSWGAPPQDVGKLIDRYGTKEITLRQIGNEATPSELEEISEEAKNYDILVLFLHTRVTAYNPQNIDVSETYVDLTEELSKLDKPFVVVSLGSPYILKKFPPVTAKVCAYSDCNVSLKATIESLEGKCELGGFPPVSLKT